MWKRIFKIFLILYIPLLLLSLFLLVSQKNGQINYFSTLQERESSLKQELFIDLFSNPIRSGRFWSQLEYPENFDPLNAHKDFMVAYIDIIKGVTEYDQFRILDLSGIEIFRAERIGVDSVTLAPLQDKHERPYYSESVDLEYGQIYLSQINLNQEYGKIETPYKPVIRVVAPIFDVNKKKLGLVVINYKMESILDRLRSNIVDNNFYLLNDDLDIVTSNTYEEHVPFEISDSVTPLNETYGLEQATFKKDTTFLQNHHIWSIHPINLNEPNRKLNFGSDSPLEILTASNWFVVQELPPKFLRGSLTFLYFSFGIFNLLAIFALMTFAYYFVKNRVQREVYLGELETKNELLSKKRKVLQINNRQISQMNLRLERRNKQLSEFNYLISHNLKAPVSSMSVIVSMIKKEGAQEKTKELLPKLVQIAESIIELTNDMGKYVTTLNENKIKVENVDIRLLINQVEKEFTGTLLEDADFKVSVDLTAWWHVKFSKFYLQSIIQNLISNSIKYRRDGVPSIINFVTAFENEKKVLYVIDNGIGIDLEKHGDNIFKLYKRFHRKVSGKGIGLFLVKSQLEALDATITVESEEQTGTTFKIIF